MTRVTRCLVIAALALVVSACSVTLPRSPASLLRKKYNSLTVYTNERIYRFSTYEIRDSVLRGISQLYKRTPETLSKGQIDDNFPPITRALALKDILRIDAEDAYNEPTFDISMYVIAPVIVVLGILVPIVIGGIP